MKGVLVGCVDCNWQGDRLEFEDTVDDLGNKGHCPRCGNIDVREIEKEEIDYIWPDDENVMMCEKCGLIPTEEELEEGVCVECGNTRFIEDK